MPLRAYLRALKTLWTIKMSAKRFERERERKVSKKLSASAAKFFERTKALNIFKRLKNTQYIRAFCPAEQIIFNAPS